MKSASGQFLGDAFAKVVDETVIARAVGRETGAGEIIEERITAPINRPSW